MTNFEKMRYLHRSAGKASGSEKAEQKMGSRTAGASAIKKKSAALPSAVKKKGAGDEERQK